MKRELLAYNLQGTMPIVKEGIETMTPLASKTVKEISKGIKEGFNDIDK